MTPYTAALALYLAAALPAAGELPQQTSLSDAGLKFTVPKKPYVVLRRGPVEVAIADNRAVDDDVLPGHRAGYSGVASLKHERRRDNLFVPAFAGLNFEHIHDGTTQTNDVLFEPRRAPMQLRQIDRHTVELYQKPTRTWGLESALRYQLLEDGTIEMTLEFIPHRASFRNKYVGLFWASYVHQPESLDIHFKGHEAAQPPASRWIRGVTPVHGSVATHRATDDDRVFPHDDDFPLTLVFNDSKYRYAEPWYYGVSHGMAMVFMFRPLDEIRLTQSPSGAGTGNPAWDFQYFVPEYQVGQRYQMIMRAMYLPYQSREQIELASGPHRKALSQSVPLTGNRR